MALLGAEVLLVAVVDQGVEVGDRLDDHVTAAAAIAAIGPAELDELLTAEGDDAGTAVARFHIDLRLIEEFHRCCPRRTCACPTKAASFAGLTRESMVETARGLPWMPGSSPGMTLFVWLQCCIGSHKRKGGTACRSPASSDYGGTVIPRRSAPALPTPRSRRPCARASCGTSPCRA